MDLSKKKTTLRTLFTKALNTFNETLRVDANQRKITVVFKLLEEKLQDLNIISNSTIDLMYEDNEIAEEQIQEEYKDADAYKCKFLAAQVNFEERTASRNSGTSNARVTFGQNESKRVFDLPKLELNKFSGNVREWLQFWSVIKKIHDAPNIVKEDKFQYLMQAITQNSWADELVTSFPPTAADYDSVIERLKSRFGLDDLQIEVYVRELLQLVLLNAVTSAKVITLSTLYNKIELYLRALKSLGATTDKFAAMLFPLVESSLPEELLRAWQRSTVNCSATSAESNSAVLSKNRLTQLIKFLVNEVQNKLCISMAMKGFILITYGNQNDSVKQKKEATRTYKDVSSATKYLFVL